MIEGKSMFRREEPVVEGDNMGDINDSDLDMLLEDLKVLDEEDISEDSEQDR